MGVVAKRVTGSVGVAAVGLVVAGTVIGWPQVWGWLTGWWTPGWGNLFTVAIASAALGVGAWYNRKTLTRTDERFAQGRVDARIDKLRAELAALLSASGQRRQQMEIFAHKVTDLIAGAQSIADRDKLMIDTQAALNETVGELYARIDAHVFAVRMLTDDSFILGRIAEIDEVLKSDLADYEVAMKLATKPTDQVATGRIARRREAQSKALALAIEQLLTYCATKFSVLD